MLVRFPFLLQLAFAQVDLGITFAPIYRIMPSYYPDFPNIPANSLLRIGYVSMLCSNFTPIFNTKYTIESQKNLFTAASQNHDVALMINFSDDGDIHPPSACMGDVSALVNVYKDIISSTGVSRIEFDYVDYTAIDRSAVKRDIIAAKLLQKEMPDLLIGISVDLDKSEAGLGIKAEEIMKLTRQAGVDYDYVFMKAYPPENAKNLIDSVSTAVNELKDLGVQSKLGVTAYLTSIQFKFDQAQALYDYAKQGEIQYLGVDEVIDDQDYKFAKLFTGTG